MLVHCKMTIAKISYYFYFSDYNNSNKNTNNNKLDYWHLTIPVKSVAQLATMKKN